MDKKTPLHWRIIRRLNPKALRRISGRPQMGNMILVLTTKGRKSGQLHKTPLQYEQHNGKYYVGSARGTAADWLRNLQANPNAEIKIAEDKFKVLAEVVTDVDSIVEFLEMRLRRHPLMIRGMLITHGLPPWAGRKQLQKLARNLAVAILTPLTTTESA